MNVLCASLHREEPVESDSYEPDTIVSDRDTVLHIAFDIVILGSRIGKTEYAVYMPGAVCGCYVSSAMRCHHVSDALCFRLMIRDFVR